MTQRLFRTSVLGILIIALLGPSPSRAGDKELRDTIAFSSSRDNSTVPPLPLLLAAEIYLISPDGDIPCTVSSCDPRRLTDNKFGDGFAKLSPDGKKIVFDSNQVAVPNGEGTNTSDLFLMNTDGSDQTFLTRGSNASWSPDGKQVAFHASASGEGRPFRDDPGSATTDSDIFVINVDDCLEQQEMTGDAEACQDPTGPIKRNLTNTPDDIEDDADWSRDGKIAFTSHKSDDNDDDSASAEIYVMDADGTNRTQLTFNDHEERGPAWSPNGSQILFMCRPEKFGFKGRFEICVMDTDPKTDDRTQLTHDGLISPGIFHGTPVWSPDGTMIVFDKVPGGPGSREMWTMPPVVDPYDPVNNIPTIQVLLTDTAGINGFANYGVARITREGDGRIAASSTDRSADTVLGPAVDDGKAEHGKQAKNKKTNKDEKDKNDNQHKKAKGGGKRHR